MKRQNPPTLVTVAIATTITVILWVFFSVYRVLTEKPPVSVPPQVLEPLSPVMNQESLNSLEGKLYFEEGSIPTFAPKSTATTSPKPTATVTVTPISTASATPKP